MATALLPATSKQSSCQKEVTKFTELPQGKQNLAEDPLRVRLYLMIHNILTLKIPSLNRDRQSFIVGNTMYVRGPSTISKADLRK